MIAPHDPAQQPQQHPQRPAGRGFWPMRDLPTILWLLLTVVAVLAHRSIPVPRWLMIHLLLLGAITQAILVWSQHFSFALLRARATPGDRRTQNLRLGLANLGAVLVCIGVPTRVWAVTALGAGILIVAVAWHGVSLVRRSRRSFAGAFGRTTRYYVASAALLVVGAVLGAIVARGGAPNLVLAHALVNVLGWIGVTVAGTVVTLWPTILRTRAAAHSDRNAARALPWLAGGALLAATGAGLGQQPVLALGLTGYLVGLTLIAMSLWVAAKRAVPRSFAALSVGAALLWWIGIVAVLFVGSIIAVVTGADLATASRLIRAIIPYLATGFAAQVLVGALSYLIPVALGGGPRAVRVGTESFDRAGTLRATVANTALLVCALPVSSLTRVIASILYLLAMSSFLVILGVAMRKQQRAKRIDAEPVPPTTSAAPPAAAPATGHAHGRRSGQATAGLLAVVLAVAVGAAFDPLGGGWAVTGGAGGSGGGAGGSGGGAGGSGGASASAPVQTVRVEAANMRFTPDRIEVPAGTRLMIELANTDAEQTHDLVVQNGTGSGRLLPGESDSVDVGVVREDLDAWCSIVGHQQMGMTLQIVALGDDDPEAGGHEGGAHGSSGEPGDGGASATPTDAPIDLLADPGPDFQPVDATLPPLPPADGPVTHRLTLTAQDAEREVAPGVTQTLWTYGGAAPGPILHGRVGDTFEVTLVNDTSMGHSIDFHAGSLAPNEAMRTIAPGETLHYTFTASRAGIWMYHCSTMPMTAHIANGMYGAVVIEPADLPEVARSYVLVQGEYYLGSHDGGVVDAEKIAGGDPDLVVFNGYAAQYDHAPLAAEVGERIRIWVLDAGLERPSSFHVVGGQFDTVWSEGRYLVDRATDTGAQALGLLPAQGGFVELTLPEPGDYPFVSHLMRDAERGAHGIIHAPQAQ